MPLDIIDTPTRRVLPVRKGPIKAAVLHTTGATDLDAIINWYRSADGLQPHYMIATTGSIRRFVDEGKVAYHCAIKPEEVELYKLGYAHWSRYRWIAERAVDYGGEYPGYRTWRDTWRRGGFQSPLELVTGAHPNACSIGIELQQPVDVTRDIFTDEQYERLAQLLGDLWHRHTIPLDRQHVLSHYDCSPMRRSNLRGSSDPGANFNWLRLWDLIGK